MNITKQLVAILPLAALLCGCAEEQGSNGGLVHAIETTAQASEDAGNYREAANMLMKAYEHDPSAKHAVHAARALRLAGAWEEAVVFIQKVKPDFPDDASLNAELVRCAMAGGFLDEAGSAVKSLEASPIERWDIYAVIGAYKAQMKDLEGAKAAFTKGAEVATSLSDRYSAQADLALVAAEEGDIDGAIANMRTLAARPGVNARVKADLEFLYELKSQHTASDEVVRLPARKNQRR